MIVAPTASSPVDRDRWLSKAVIENARGSYSVGHRANGLLGQQKQVEVEKALEAKRAQYLGTSDPAQRQHLLDDMEGIVGSAQQTGLIHPLVGQKLTNKHIGGTVYDGAKGRLLNDTDGVMKDLKGEGGEEFGGSEAEDAPPEREATPPEEVDANRPLDGGQETADESDAAAVEDANAQ